MLFNTIMSLPDDTNLMQSEQVHFYLMTDSMSCEIAVHSSYSVQSSVNVSDYQCSINTLASALKDT